MKRRALICLLAVTAVLCTACSHPPELKTAAQLQLEALREAQRVTTEYVGSVDRLMAEGIAISEEAQRMMSTSRAVDEVMKKIGLQEKVDLLAASDEVALKIFQAQQEKDMAVVVLETVRRDHAENLGYLIQYLQLLERSQQLLVDYLITDIGPTEGQLTELGAAVQTLGGQLGGGGS